MRKKIQLVLNIIMGLEVLTYLVYLVYHKWDVYVHPELYGWPLYGTSENAWPYFFGLLLLRALDICVMLKVLLVKKIPLLARFGVVFLLCVVYLHLANIFWGGLHSLGNAW